MQVIIYEIKASLVYKNEWQDRLQNYREHCLKKSNQKEKNRQSKLREIVIDLNSEGRNL